MRFDVVFESEIPRRPQISRPVCQVTYFLPTEAFPGSNILGQEIRVKANQVDHEH